MQLSESMQVISITETTTKDVRVDRMFANGLVEFLHQERAHERAHQLALNQLELEMAKLDEKELRARLAALTAAEEDRRNLTADLKDSILKVMPHIAKLFGGSKVPESTESDPTGEILRLLRDGERHDVAWGSEAHMVEASGMFPEVLWDLAVKVEEALSASDGAIDAVPHIQVDGRRWALPPDSLFYVVLDATLSEGDDDEDDDDQTGAFLEAVKTYSGPVRVIGASGTYDGAYHNARSGVVEMVQSLRPEPGAAIQVFLLGRSFTFTHDDAIFG